MDRNIPIRLKTQPDSPVLDTENGDLEAVLEVFYAPDNHGFTVFSRQD
jgi:hypothetical protein